MGPSDSRTLVVGAPETGCHILEHFFEVPPIQEVKTFLETYSYVQTDPRTPSKGLSRLALQHGIIVQFTAEQGKVLEGYYWERRKSEEALPTRIDGMFTRAEKLGILALPG